MKSMSHSTRDSFDLSPSETVMTLQVYPTFSVEFENSESPEHDCSMTVREMLARVRHVLQLWHPSAGGFALWVTDMPQLNRLCIRLDQRLKRLNTLNTSGAAEVTCVAATRELYEVALAIDELLRTSAMVPTSC